jgi:hypothetical protein
MNSEVRIAAMGFVLLHIPACMDEGRDFGAVFSAECLWRGLEKTVFGFVRS